MDWQQRNRRVRIFSGLALTVAILTVNALLPRLPAPSYQVEALGTDAATLTIEQVRSASAASWRKVDPRQLAQTAVGACEVWLRVTLPPSPGSEKWVAELATPFLRQVDFYLSEGQLLTGSAFMGMDRPLVNRTYSSVNHAFGFNHSPVSSQRLYIRAYSEVAVYLPLQLTSEEAFNMHMVVRHTLLGLLLGIFLGIVLYNLFICISLRDRVYFYYCAYEISLFLIGCMFSGVIQTVLPQFASDFSLAVRTMVLTLIVTTISFSLFIQEFAALKHNDQVANRLILPFILVLMLLVGPALLMPLPLVIAAVLVIVWSGVLALVCGMALRAKTRREFYLFLSFVGLGSCMVIQLATMVGALEASYLSEWVLLIGGIWQALLLSMALAERIVALQEEKKAIIRTLKGDGPVSELNSLLGSAFNRSHSLSEMNVSIVFIDIVGFSQLAEILGSHRVFTHLARLIQDITVIVQECNGTIDRSLGDGVLCIFGYERGQHFRHHAQDAFRAARRIQEDIVDRFQDGAGSSDYVLPVRIGIHVADVLIGDVGGTRRVDFTMIGSGVNFASRLETACSPFRIMLSAACHSRLAKADLARPGFAPILVAVKNQQGLVNAYEFNPFTEAPERLELVEKLHLDQLSRKAQDSRHVVVSGQPVQLLASLGSFNLLDFSSHGFRVLSAIYVGRKATLLVELRTFDQATNQLLAELLLDSFYVEVRWSRGHAGGYEHGLQIYGLNDAQKDRIFRVLAALYSPRGAALDQLIALKA